MSTTSTSSIFSGTSRYSNDFQQIVARAVAIAGLPKTQMQNVRKTLAAQSSAVSALDARFEAVQSALSGLGAATGAYGTFVSEGSVASASVTGGALPGVYRFEVVSLGSQSVSMSKDGLVRVSNPSRESISAAATFTLALDGRQYQIVPASGSLSALAKAINSSEAGVEATVVNIGSAAEPDYRLSLRSAALGAADMKLDDGSGDLLDSITAGSPAEYRVHGQPAAAVASSSRTVSIAPGLAVTMLKAGSAEITVSRNSSALSGALSALASAYNAAAGELDRHRGEDPGALKGSSLLGTLSRALRDLVSYESGAGGISSLASLGMVFDDKGRLSLDMTVFSAAVNGNHEALESFLGSASTGGFLRHAAGLLDGLENSSDGIIETAASSLRAETARLDSRIAEEQERIDRLEQHLLARMAAADALIASLEQQVRYMSGLFESMRSWRERL